MTNRGFRMISSAILAAGGGIATSIGFLAAATDSAYSGGEGLGGLLAAVGCVLFFIDWIGSWREEREPSPSSSLNPSNPHSTQ